MHQQFSAAFKMKVIEFSEANGNVVPQCQFGISENCSISDALEGGN